MPHALLNHSWSRRWRTPLPDAARHRSPAPSAPFFYTIALSRLRSNRRESADSALRGLLCTAAARHIHLTPSSKKLPSPKGGREVSLNKCGERRKTGSSFGTRIIGGSLDSITWTDLSGVPGISIFTLGKAETRLSLSLSLSLFCTEYRVNSRQIESRERPFGGKTLARDKVKQK